MRAGAHLCRAAFCRATASRNKACARIQKGRPPMRHLLAILLLILSGTVAAREVPIKDFFKDAEFESVLLSPDGEHIAVTMPRDDRSVLDRKSTRLNSSHSCAPRMPSSA